MRKASIWISLLGLMFVILAGNAFPGSEIHPLEPVDVSSPRATLESFIQNSRKAAEAYKAGNYQDAKKFARRLLQTLNLDQELPDLKEAIGFESMLYLVEVLHRVEIPPYGQIPDKKAVEDQKITSWTIPNTEITIALGTDGPSKTKFLFTPEMVSQSSAFYRKIKDLPYVWGDQEMDLYADLTSHGGLFLSRRFISLYPGWAMASVFGLRLWQWIGLIIFVLSAVLSTLLTYIYGRKALAALDRRIGSGLERVIGGLILPLGLIFFPKIGLWFVVYGLHIFNSDIYLPTAFGFLILLYAGGIWFISAILNRVSGAVIFLGGFAKGGMDTQLIRLGFQIVGLIIIGMLAIDFGARLGLPTYSMVTGLGIGGLAVALAGREALSNLIGTIMIILDQPFKPGDFIVVGDGEHGTVTEVGFRSTRIRTRDGILISIPNSTIANMKIINQSAPVTKSRIHAPVGVAYGSDPKVVEDALLAVAARSEYVSSEPAPLVRIIGFGDSAINFSLLCWIRLPEFRGRAMAQLNRYIYEEFRKRGVSMPFPQRDVHVISNK